MKKSSASKLNFLISALVHTLLLGCAFIFFPKYTFFNPKENLTIHFRPPPPPASLPTQEQKTIQPSPEKQLPQLPQPQNSREFIPSAIPTSTHPQIPNSSSIEIHSPRAIPSENTSEWLSQHIQNVPSEEIILPEDCASEIFPQKNQTTSAPNIQKIPVKWHHRLYSQLVYPSFARRNNWEGNVTITIITAENGKLGAYHIKKSSGYKLLDSCSIDALKKLFPIPELHPFTTYELTICFRLK